MEWYDGTIHDFIHLRKYYAKANAKAQDANF